MKETKKAYAKAKLHKLLQNLDTSARRLRQWLLRKLTVSPSRAE